jgi:hypothetical protein
MDELVYICEICQTVLEEHHCKAQCPNCGRMFDCSDLPLIPANGAIDDVDGEFTLRPGSNPLDLLPKSTSPSKKLKSASDASDANIADLP